MSRDTKSPSAPEIYQHAAEIPVESARKAYLDAVCGQDTELRERVEKLLAARNENRDNLLQRATPNFAEEGSFAENGEIDTGETNLSNPEAMGISETDDESIRGLIDVSQHPLIGHYKLLEEIGHGGMGTVYMAEQTEPVTRRVALKVIKPGMDTKEVIARFEAERQALALMDHAHIAKVLDGGTTDEGRPYFVMELVRGVSITEFCKQKKLPLQERLELFIDICKAVQHAHQKGIIHRDLKPSNLLVTMHDHLPVVKVIDFGVAKALNQKLTGRTLFTQFSQMVGTPLYMAPEQAQMSGLDVDTRSDIYSLGVILYELLTETTPFDKETMSSLGVDGIRKLINEQEPQRPSARLSTMKVDNGPTIDDERTLDAEDVAKQLKRELDWIVMKALEKDRERRYESANAFAADVQRYLNDEPVEACPPTLSYRLKKYAKKHKAWLTTAALLIVMLMTSTAVSGVFAYQANEAKEEAKHSEIAANNALSASQASEAEAVKQARIAKIEANRADQESAFAKMAAAREKSERHRAETALYVSDTRLAAAHLKNDERADAFSLLLNHVPQQQRQDSRGWEWYYLLDQSNQALLSWQASSTNVRSIDWSPDGTEIATAHWDGNGATIWDGETGEPIRSLTGGRTLKVGIDWHPGGNMLAWGSVADESQVRVWDQEKDEIIQLNANVGSHRCVRWSPDGTLLALATIKGSESEPDNEGFTIAMWEKSEDGFQLLKRIKTGTCSNLAWSPSGDKLAVLKGSEAIIVDPDTLEFLKTLPQKNLASIAWHPTSNKIALGTNNGAIVIVDAETEEEVNRFHGHAGNVVTVAWSPNGELLSSGGEDRAVHVWEIGNEVPTSTFMGHDAIISEVSWHPDSNRLASCGQDGRINIWPTKTRRDRLEIKNVYARHAVYVNSFAQRFVWVGDDVIRSVANRKEITDFNIKTGDSSVIGKIEGGLEGRMASANVTFAVDHGLWKHRQIPIGLHEDGQFRRSLTLENAGLVWASEFDGDEVVYATAPAGELYLYSFANDSRLKLGRENHYYIKSVIWSPDESLIAAIGHGVQSDDGTPQYAGWVHLFDSQTGDKLGRARVGHRRITARAGDWSPDGGHIVATTDDGICQVYEAPSLAPKLSRRFHSLKVTSASWHPSEPRIASGSTDGSLVVWNAESGDLLLKFLVDSPIVQVEWFADGKLLAAGIDNGTIFVWDATDGYEYAQSDAITTSMNDRWNVQLSNSLLTGDFAMAFEKTEDLLTLGKEIDVYSIYRVAVIGASLDKQPEYQRYSEQAIQQFLKSENPFEAHFTAWTCALAPDALDDYEPAIKLARQAVEQEPNN